MQWYDVALWRWWPSLFPEWCEVVEAASAFAAVEAVMRLHGCMTVKHAAAQTMDGLLVYRGFGVKLVAASAGACSAGRSVPDNQASSVCGLSVGVRPAGGTCGLTVTQSWLASR
jgi:hypothetical protein